MASTTLVDYFRSAVLILLPEKCYDEFFVNLNFADVPCLKAAISKALGITIVAGSFMAPLAAIFSGYIRDKPNAGCLHQPSPQYCGPDVRHPALVLSLIHPLKMAASGVAETFGFSVNLGPRPNSLVDILHTIKLPQIIKILKNQSATGISFLGVLLELYAVTTGVAYSYNKGFTFSAWGEALFLLLQTAVVAMLVLHYNRSPNAAAIFVGVYSVILYILVAGMTPLDVLWSLQAVSVPLIFTAKMVQAYTNYKNGSTGQLSAITCVMLLFGSSARIFTSIQETGDAVFVVTYALATIGNAILVGQFVYYHYKSKNTSKPKKSKKNANKKNQ